MYNPQYFIITTNVLGHNCSYCNEQFTFPQSNFNMNFTPNLNPSQPIPCVDPQCDICGRGPPKSARQETIVYQKHLPGACSFCGDASYLADILPENKITVNVTNTQRVIGGTYAQYYRPDHPLNVINANPSTRVIQDVAQSNYIPTFNVQSQEVPQRLFENIRLGQSQVIDDRENPQFFQSNIKEQLINESLVRAESFPVGIRNSMGITMTREKSIDLGSSNEKNPEELTSNN